MSVDQEPIEQTLERLLDSKLDKIFKAGTTPQWLTNKEACNFLKVEMATLNRRIAEDTYIRGYHYTGEGRDRRWSQERLDRWLIVRDDPQQQTKDLAKWQQSIEGKKK
jgi:hypothetical protein